MILQTNSSAERIRPAEPAALETAEAGYATGRSLILAGDRRLWRTQRDGKLPASFRVASRVRELAA